MTTVTNLGTEIFYGKPVQTVQTPETTGPKDRQQIIERLKEIRNSVSVFEQFLPFLLSHLQDACSNFRAGCIANNFVAWTEITNDKEVLSDVSGIHIDCIEGPFQHWLPPQKFDDHESNRIDQEVSKLVEKRVIERVEYTPHHILSSIILTPKKDGSYRLMFNLKKFNSLIVNHHFKMDSLHTIKPSC